MDIAIYDIKRALDVRLGESPKRLIQALAPYKDHISSAHLCNEYDVVNSEGISLFEQDLELLATLGVKVGVLHLRAPCSIVDVQRQFGYLHPLVSRYGVTVAIENLPDSRNRSQGFPWIQDPVVIANYLDVEQWLGFGLCLDTSHAICCGYTCWDAPVLGRQVVAIHLSASIPGKDLHQPIDANTDVTLLSNVADLACMSVNECVMIVEQLDFAGSLGSVRYLKSRGW